jgi:hypothetical protein
MSYYDKYMKYKAKYTNLKSQIGGGDFRIIVFIKDNIDYSLMNTKMREQHNINSQIQTEINKLDELIDKYNDTYTLLYIMS